MATDTPTQPPDDPNPTVSSAEATADQDAPASPPLPPKPTLVTPGPRAARLQEVFADRLKHTLAKLSYDNVAACYPTIAAKAPATLRAVQGQMVSLLGRQCQKEFDNILAARDVVAKLNELEALVSDAARRKGESPDGKEAPVPPHLLPPSQILAAHLSPHLASQQSQLNARLQTTQLQNVVLFDEIRAQREEAAELLAAVEKVLADVDGANGLLDEVVDDLAAEARTVEVEMGGT